MLGSRQLGPRRGGPEKANCENMAKKGAVAWGREGSVLRGYAGGSVGQTRLDHADADAFSDPAFYIECPDRGAAGMRGWSEG